jgi:hypothetical protein
VAKQRKFDSSSPGWAEVLALVLDMSTAACFGTIEQARMLEVHTRMTADSSLSSLDRNRFLASLRKMLHEGVL